ncbi:MAG: YihY/virulence factor BrkB family protein, partial [Cytophagales bacterium]
MNIDWDALHQALTDFFKYKVLKLSASLAFFTFFSFPSMLVLAISSCGYFFGKDAVRGRLFNQINDWVGDKAASQIQNILKSVYVADNNHWTTWLAIIFLVLSAQSVFEEIKDSLRTMFEIKAKPQKDWAVIIFNRIVSFVLVAITGVALTFSLSLNFLLTAFSVGIKEYLPRGAGFVISLSNYLSIAIIFVGVSTFVYKFLPEIKIYWKSAFHGAILATVLLI